MVKPDCPRCKSTAFVRKETVVKAEATIESLYCGRCDHSWNQSGVPYSATDPERPDRSRSTPRKHN